MPSRGPKDHSAIAHRPVGFGQGRAGPDNGQPVASQETVRRGARVLSRRRRAVTRDDDHGDADHADNGRTLSMPPSPLDGLPPDFPDDPMPAIRAAVADSGRKLVALDDDPTGVQTVHDTAVLANPSVADLAAELCDPRPVCFVLTNSRALPAAAAVALNRQIGADLVAAARQTGVGLAVASRGDSTLRGHYPAETDALAAALGGVDGLLLAPAFFEGGRSTVGDVHWVRDGERVIPAAETEFARDATFGYTRSNLREWVEEQTGGRIRAAEVASLSIADVRRGGPDLVAERLTGVRGGQVVVVNAASYRDLEVVALGVLRAEAAGRRFLYRTAAGFVRVRAGLAARPLLGRTELVGADAPTSLPGLVVVGSHVARTGEQLTRLLALPGVVEIELRVGRVLDAATRDAEIRSVGAAAGAALARGETPVVSTTRAVARVDDPDARLATGQAVSAALVATVRAVAERPGWIVAKGGITASDIGTEALGARRAIVLGQVSAGVPVWRLGPETRHPGLPYVVFPGNVGGPDALAEVVATLRGE